MLTFNTACVTWQKAKIEKKLIVTGRERGKRSKIKDRWKVRKITRLCKMISCEFNVKNERLRNKNHL